MSTLPAAIARNVHLIGASAVFLSIATWAMEFGGVVEVCPYCQVQRTAIGVLGVLLLLPMRGCWWIRYAAGVVGAFGAVTAATQHFNGWMAIHKGTFQGFSPIYASGFLLSAFALMVLVGEWMILSDLHGNRPRTAGEADLA
jgi:disulfide bond formation protein DsbB